MNKKLLITSTDLMMVQFLLPHVRYLSEQGYVIDLACSDVGNRLEEVREKINDCVNSIYQVRLHRSPLSADNLNGYKDMKKIIDSNHYDIIWTNEPVMGVATRLAARDARKQGTKVVYMVHGFHFYKGAPLVNWLIYYPIEKMMASCADVICTVNREDYKRAQSFRVNRVEYVHGIGINTERLSKKDLNHSIREELRLSHDDFLVLSVGELNKNKNQKVVLEAVAKLKDRRIHCIFCGKGEKREKLQKQAEGLGIHSQVHFLGYRKDVVNICAQADMYVMPSMREGLPVAALEAMYCGLPLVTSDIRGLCDIMEDNVTGFTCAPKDVEGFSKGIYTLKEDSELRRKMGRKNREVVREYCIEHTKSEVEKLLNSL